MDRQNSLLTEYEKSLQTVSERITSKKGVPICSASDRKPKTLSIIVAYYAYHVVENK